jgi:hypothetical protein
MNNKLIKDIIKERNSSALFLEEKFDKALIGSGITKGKNISATYDSDRCIEILIKEYGMEEMEAFKQFNDSIDSMADGSNSPMFFSDFTGIKDLPDIWCKEEDTLENILDDILP